MLWGLRVQTIPQGAGLEWGYTKRLFKKHPSSHITDLLGQCTNLVSKDPKGTHSPSTSPPPPPHGRQGWGVNRAPAWQCFLTMGFAKH